MSINRLRALRLFLFCAYVLAGLGVGIYYLGWFFLVAGAPGAFLLFIAAGDWLMAIGERRELSRMTGIVALDMGAALRHRGAHVIDDDPAFGTLYESRRDFGHLLAAVKVRNATPEPDGSYKEFWLRVPSRGDEQLPRFCRICTRDIAFPPRTAREAVAWTFQLCEKDYEPAVQS